MSAGKSSDRTMVLLKILHSYLYHSYAELEERNANEDTKKNLLAALHNAMCVLAHILDHDYLEDVEKETAPPKIDDTRIFGHTVKEFNNLPNEVKRKLMLPLKFTVFEPVQFGSTSPWSDTQVDADPVQLPFTENEYKSMSREEADKAIHDATCHMAHPVLRYRFKEEK